MTPDQLRWVLDHNMQIRGGHRVQIGDAVEAWHAVIRERELLRSALVGLVGADGRDELGQMEAAMRLLSAPAADKAVTIDAIHALLATLEPPQAGAAVDPVGELAKRDPSTRDKASSS